MVLTKMETGQVSQIQCAQEGCGKNLNDLDIKALGLRESIVKEYEEYSLHAAIEQMDDIGWCPLPGCKSIANIEKAENVGRCQHCEFLFCLDCRQGQHPFKRCPKNRVDLQDRFADDIKQINLQNKEYALKLSQLFIKYCTKPCPNPKCHAPITKEPTGCTHI